MGGFGTWGFGGGVACGRAADVVGALAVLGGAGATSAECDPAGGDALEGGGAEALAEVSSGGGGGAATTTVGFRNTKSAMARAATARPSATTAAHSPFWLGWAGGGSVGAKATAASVERSEGD